MKKKIIKRSACLLAMAIAVSAMVFRPDTAYGAAGIETDRKCSLTFQMPESGAVNGTAAGGNEAALDQVSEKYYQYYTVLNELLENGESVSVKLYRVADVSVNGSYTATGKFLDMDKEIHYKKVAVSEDKTVILFADEEGYAAAEAEEKTASLKTIDSRTTAEQWEALAKRADSLKNAENPDISRALTAGNMQISELDTGMYLVCVDRMTTDEYFYDFVPFLISLPNNYYSLPDGNPISDDSWVYDVAVGLKPEQAARFGTLIINKQLLHLNQLEGVINRQGTFVFDVKAEKSGSPDFEYSNVVSLYFNGTDGISSKFVTIGPDREKAVNDPNYYFAEIPAGSQVTVKEVYSGAEYTAVSGDPQTIGFAGGSFFHADAENEENNKNQVTFQNAYDGRLNNGTSVVNRYQTGENGGIWNQQQTEQTDNQ